jgi:outer membrane receptor protein involved in Fe transport
MGRKRWRHSVLLGVLLGPPVAAQDYMSLSLEDLMRTDIGVASRVSGDARRQPSSVSVIERAQILGSAARTLNELLMLHVPGYFLVEDQDDTIAGLRGLAPDNNSKILLLLDGRSLNADWFWGPPDAVLNGLDLDFIERIEVIRGPGSVTLGQGALIGVINIVTRSPDTAPVAELSAVAGADGRRGLGWRQHRGFAEDGRLGLYLADGEHDGEPYRNEGVGTQVEQGLSVFERNHHLKRGRYRTVLVDLENGAWRGGVFRFDQRRDLYNWRRDREAVRQVLLGGHLGWRRALGVGELDIELQHQVDDYLLSAHGGTRPEATRQLIAGLVLGGHRESRSGARLLWTSSALWEGHRLALGGEWNHYRSGEANRNGDNFIVNTQEAVLESGRALLNQRNRWALPSSTAVRSLFVEDFIAFGERWEGFVAARWDDHPDWGSQVSPRLGLLWQATPALRWRLSTQSGFRGAVGVNYSGGFEGDGLLREANFAAIEANPYFAANGSRNLRPVEPERSRNVELALHWEPPGRLSAHATLFHTETRNVIGVGAYFLADPAQRAAAIAEGTRIGSDRIGDWGGVFYFQNNPGELRHRGAELELVYRDSERGLQLRLSHAHVRVAHADAGQFGPGNIYVSGSSGDPLARSFPEDVSRAHLEWRPRAANDRLGLQLSVLHYPHWYPPVAGESDGVPALDGNTQLNLGLDWQPPWWPGGSISLQVKNVGEASALYPTTSVAGEEAGNLGAPALESRSAWVTVRHRF